MRLNFFHFSGQAISLSSLILAAGLAASVTRAEPMHGIAMYGAPQLPPDFVSLPYANPDAPKGGSIVEGEVGGFDSLNPHIPKGSTPWQLRFLAYESLMGRNWDEPFTLYGLLAESIDVGPNREWVEFTLRPEARFSDGTPVTIEDVMWSYETLGTVGHARYRGTWSAIETMEQTGPNSVRFTFNVDNRELALIVGLRPILKKAQWDDVDFTESGLDNVPIATAPYVIEEFEASRYVKLVRNPDYWGKDLPFRQGTQNFDEVRLEFFGDATAQFEAFKAGILTTNREFNAEKWVSQYDFPAVLSGDVIKTEIAHERPTGMQGFFMNTRRDVFKDWRVREAMLHAFNFEFINETVTGSAQPRIESYFDNSYLAMEDGPATGRVKELLEPFAEDLLPGALDAYDLPVSDGTERNRGNIRKALALLEEAGWTVQDGVMTNADGEPFEIEILLRNGSAEVGATADLFVEALRRLGITGRVTSVENAQYRERVGVYDYDITYNQIGMSLSPGNEQRTRYWGCDLVEAERSRNYAGVCSHAAEAMIDTMLTSTSSEDFIVATKALDRVLTTGRYAIPLYQFNISRVAHASSLIPPVDAPIYGDWISWQIDTWWYEAQ